MRGSLLSSADYVAPIISSICASKTSSLKERKEEGVGGEQKSTRWQSLEVWSDIKSTTYVRKI